MIILSIKKIFNGQLKGDETDCVPPSSDIKITEYPNHPNCKCTVTIDLKENQETIKQCPICGHEMVKQRGCYVCLICGYSPCGGF